MESLLNTGGAFRPQIVKVGALSAPTQDMLLKYCLDLSYIQTVIYIIIPLTFPILQAFPPVH